MGHHSQALDTAVVKEIAKTEHSRTIAQDSMSVFGASEILFA
jgi:hypothetical protein